MKIPVKWLKEYVDIPANLRDFTDKMSMIGHMLDKTEETDNDTVIDLELRGNRADCYAILGIARESHASFGGRFQIPTPTHHLPQTTYNSFKVEVQTPVVHRFYSTVIRNLKIGPSPEWMQKRLKDYGLDPINNIVDITNYVMIETGMPLHAFDLDRMDGNKLILRQAKKGEKTTTFDGTVLELTNEDAVFVGENGRILGLCGIIGEKESGIHDNTVNILLECAGYDRATIRRSMFRHKSQTEAGLRHSHDLHASLCDYALERAASLIIELAGDNDPSKIEGIDDYYPNPSTLRVINYKPSEAKRLGGIDISVEEQAKILRRLECIVEIENDVILNEVKNPEFKATREHQDPSTSLRSAQDDNSSFILKITPPLFRTDLIASEDIVEEVLRIYGYENIPSTAISSAIPDPIIQPELVVEEKTKDILTGLGLNELITVPMTTLEKMEKALEPKKNFAITLVNPASSEHTTMRVSLYVGLLEAIGRMLDRGDEKIEVFEVGKIYHKKDKPIHQPPHKPEFPYVEWRRVTALFSGKNNKDVDFYSAKGVLEEYLNQLQLTNYELVKFDHPQFEYAASIEQNGLILGAIGLLKKEITEKAFGIKSDVYTFTMLVENLVTADKSSVNYMPYSAYPAMKQDISVLYDPKYTAAEIEAEIRKNGGELVRNIEITDVFTKDNQRSVLFSITYQSKERTLSTEEVNQVHGKIGDELTKKFGAVIRGREASLSNKDTSIEDPSLGLSAVEAGKVPDMAEGVNEDSNNSDKIVVGKILEIIQHPNADRLVICKIDVGAAKPAGTLNENYLQIVTGADNIKPGIAEGKYIPVALPGAEVLNYKTGEQFKIGIGNLRGEVSEGMLCSKSELGVKDSEGGIWILESGKYEGKVGKIFTEYLKNKSQNLDSISTSISQKYETEPIYLTDSYQKEMDAKVLDVVQESDGNYKLILDQTVFYPMGGGQATDQGTLKSEKWEGQVYQVLNKDGNLSHYVKSSVKPEIGDSVHGTINWDRRYKNMKLHSAGHIVDFAMYLLGYTPTTLMSYKGDHNKDPHIVYKGTLSEDLNIVKEKLEAKANELVQNGLKLTTEVLPIEQIQKEAIYLQPGLPMNKPLRILRLEGVGAVADGGTQVSNTNEIGKIELNVSQNSDEVIIHYSVIFN